MLERKSPSVLRAFPLCAIVSLGLLVSTEAIAEDSPPRVDLSQPHPQPAYPDSARAGGEQGTVLVDVYVRSTGKVEKYRVSQSSGFGDLDEAAVEDVLNWHYIPAVHDGDPVSDWTTVKVVFQLPQPEVQPAQKTE